MQHKAKLSHSSLTPNRWSSGPPFLLQSSDTWPESPKTELLKDTTELQKAIFCGATVTSCDPTKTEDKVYDTWQELMEVTTQVLRGQTPFSSPPTAEEYCCAETNILIIFNKPNSSHFQMITHSWQPENLFNPL